jgi:peptide chain release factor subunit 1
VSELTWDVLRDLAGFRAAEPTALSFCAKLDPSESPTPQSLSTRFNSLLAQVEKRQLGNGGGHKKEIRAGLERVREWAKAEFDRDGARGVAVFVSTADHFWRVLRIPEPVDDHVEVDRQLALAPLVPLVRDVETFVAQLDRERGIVFRIVDGRLEEVVDESDEVPGQHDQGGWSQARYARHIEELVKRRLKDVGAELSGEVRRIGAPQLVIVAPDELRPEIEATLTPEAKDAIVGWTNAEAHVTPAELHELVRPILDRARAERERRELERWREQLGRNVRAAAGWHDTLEAASDARVELLLTHRGARTTGYRCPRCLRAAAEPGTCPLDGSELEQHDALDLAVHQTLVHGGSVLSLDEPRGLDSVGALLRF